jgi:hypothetical protein
MPINGTSTIRCRADVTLVPAPVPQPSLIDLHVMYVSQDSGSTAGLTVVSSGNPVRPERAVQIYCFAVP